MKHHIVEPAAKSLDCETARPAAPEDLRPIVEDPKAEVQDMAPEQKNAFVSPSHEEERVLRSQGDQGRT